MSKKVVFITALRLEFQAVKGFLENCREQTHKGTVYERGEFLEWKIGLAEIGQGNPNAARETEKAIEFFEPDYVFFVGVAGGIKDVTLGDVVVADIIRGYERGKETDAVFLSRSEVGQSSYELVQRARATARNTDWLQNLNTDSNPTARIGNIAAGEKVVATEHSITYERLITQCSDALAVEMEGIGFLTAIHANNAKGIVIRGISDLLGNKSESDKLGWQEKAAHHAAAFAFAMLQKLDPNNDSVSTELPDNRFPPLPDKYPFFIGRTEKCNEVIAAITRFRLVTIKSIGGIGKTALARAVLNSPEIRQKFDNRIAWVGLDVVACDSKDAVIAVIAEQLNLNERSYSVEDEQLSSLIDRVVKALIGNEVLLVLDSCEPVVNSVRELCIELQALAFELYVLATLLCQYDLRHLPLGN